MPSNNTPSNGISLPGYPSTNSPTHHPTSALLPFLCQYEGAPPPTYSHLPHCSSIPLRWGIKLPWD